MCACFSVFPDVTDLATDYIELENSILTTTDGESSNICDMKLTKKNLGS